MTKASTVRRCRTAGTVFDSGHRGAFTLLSAVFVAFMTVSCVHPSPPGDVNQLTVAEVQAGTMKNGARLRWGGTIAKVRNKADVTVLEIVSRPLLRSGRPRHNDVTDGRFLAEIDGFLDPEIVSPGRDISLVGLVRRIDSGHVGEADYLYPVMSVFDYRVWQKADEINQNYGQSHFFTFDRIWRDWPYKNRSQGYGNVRF